MRTKKKYVPTFMEFDRKHLKISDIATLLFYIITAVKVEGSVVVISDTTNFVACGIRVLFA